DVGPDAPAYLRFLVALDLTLHEWTTHRRRLLRLARSRVPGVVSAALPLLGKLDRGGRLDPADAVSGPARAGRAASAATGGAAGGLTAAAVLRRPELIVDAAAALTPALTHPKPDVQLAAVTVLAPSPDPAVRAALAAAAGSLAPTVAAELARLSAPTT